MLDLVYVVREGERNDELRYSLRSVAANLAHTRVWVVGHKPAWLTDVEHIPTAPGYSKYKNTTASVLAACEHDDVPDRFVLMNDDFFVMEPMVEVPVLNRGPVEDVEGHLERMRNLTMLNGLRDTRRTLAAHGYDELLSFELHVPLPVEKGLMARAVRMGAEVDCWHKRTAYGAIAGLEGVTIADVKVHTIDAAMPDGPFVSTNDTTFGAGVVGKAIRASFPDPSPYELPRELVPHVCGG